MRSHRPRTPLRLGLLAVVTCSVALAACHDGPDAPPTGPTATTAATTAPATTTPTGPTGTTAGTTAATTPATTLPTTPPTTGPTTSGGNDPRTVPLRTLLRPGTRPLRALYGDLDGDGVEDIVLAAVDRSPPPGTAIAQAYLDVFLADGHGGWPQAWEATGAAPPGPAGAPVQVVTAPNGQPPSQQLDFVALPDMAGDGSPDLAIGVLNVGAGPGPLDVWVLGFGPNGPATEFWEETTQGGILVAAGDTLRLQTPAFAPGDASCCPSRIEHQTIGFDPAEGTVRVLERTFTPVG